MIRAVSGDIRKQGRYPIESSAGRPRRWRTDFIGQRARQDVEDHPQAFLIEMDAHARIGMHFHQVDQFQVLLAGSGSLAGNPAPLVALHYVDRQTVNGPVDSGPYGLSIFTMRLKCDPGATHQHQQTDGVFATRHSRKRYLAATSISLSTEPVLQSRMDVVLDTLLGGDADGMGAYLLRLGADMSTIGPDPRLTGGQFYLVLNGSMVLDGANYPAWSTINLSASEAPLTVRAGPAGLETLVLNFSREAS